MLSKYSPTYASLHTKEYVHDHVERSQTHVRARMYTQTHMRT